MLLCLTASYCEAENPTNKSFNRLKSHVYESREGSFVYDAEILKYLKTAVSYFQIRSHKPFCYKSRSNPLQDITNFQKKQVLILRKEI